MSVHHHIKFVFYNLTTFVLKNLRQLFDKYAVARTEHDALVKSTTKIFCGLLRKPKLYLVAGNTTGGRLCPTMALLHLKNFVITPLKMKVFSFFFLAKDEN